VREKLQAVAKISAPRWNWRVKSGKSCEKLMARSPEVHELARQEYNLAVAASASLFAQAAREYEKLGRP
jgi:hypothetical protein